MSIGSIDAPPRREATPTPMLRARYGGLDGLRAIAVGFVLVYHLFPGMLPGGFLGVDVFFAISGFLITSLLLTERSRTGTIRLVEFWRRRARRLLPALGLVLVTSATIALAVGGDILVGVGRQITGAALFVSNWSSIAAGADYFARDAPELLRNTWSLGIEEQFYLVLPLIAILLLGVSGRAGKLARPIVFGVLGVVSAVLMFVWSFGGVDPSRLYFGSDTHSFGLFLGAALACVLHRGVHEGAEPGHPVRQWPLIVAATLGFATIAALALTLEEGSPESFRGGIQLATFASLVVIWAVTRPGLRFAAALDVAPLRWVGERSYGIYLWHWPLLLLTQATIGPWSREGLGWFGTGFGVLLLTLGLAHLSYRYVEQPVRRMGLRRSLRRLFHLGRGAPRQRVVALALSLILLICIPGTVAAALLAPSVTSAEAAIARGRVALTAEEDAGQNPHEDDGPRTDASDNGKANAPTPNPNAPAVTPIGSQLTAIGDSVMLASGPELDGLFPGIKIDAEVSRGLDIGVGLAEGQHTSGELRYALIIGLGTNGPIDIVDLNSLRTAADGHPLVLVNAHADRDWIPGVNELLTDFAAAHRGVVVADWTGAISPTPELLAGDGIHPGSDGGAVYANAVAAALQQLNEPTEAIGYSGPRR